MAAAFRPVREWVTPAPPPARPAPPVYDDFGLGQGWDSPMPDPVPRDASASPPVLDNKIFMAIGDARTDAGRLFLVREAARQLRMDDAAVDTLRRRALSCGLSEEDVGNAIAAGIDAATAPVTPYAAPAPARRPTPESTIQALMYALRHGLSCLANPANREQLSRCDADAMKHIATELAGWKSSPHDWLPAWGDHEIEQLTATWRALRGGGR
jgi:hypothetical protein